jgi:hypothetical protein
MLIKSKNEEGVLPLRTVTNSLIDVLDELLSLRNRGRRVERLNRAAFRINVGEAWERSGCGILVKLFKRLLE